MSTQPFSSLSETSKPFTAESAEERREEQQESTGKSACATQSIGATEPVCATQSTNKSLLDEPWKVTLLPAAPVGEDPRAAKRLPWRVGDVVRLKDDSPKGMMEYIATHSTGWWKEMADRALRDTEKAERMAREAGWQHGQYWALEVDAEAKQKLLDAEEAKRAREEAARAKEEAEKEAFVQRQMELLKKAGRAPRCEYQYTNGRGCKAPQMRGERWCHGHAKMMSYRPEKLEILPMEDEQAVMVNLYRVTNSLLAGRISEKVAGLTLWSIAIGMPGARKLSPQRSQRRQRRKTTNLPRINSDTRGFKRKAHRGAAETRRKTRNNSPQMNADEHRSGGKVGRELTRTNTNQEDARRGVDSGTQPQPANTAPSGDSGVTNGKSFVSGVRRGSTTKDRRDRRHLAPAGQQRAGRGPRRATSKNNTDHGGTETRRNPVWPKPTADVTSQKINSLSKGTLCPRSPY